VVIALTGKCCSGKNYISDIFSRNGFTIIDVDNISRDVFDDSSDKILELFGTTDRSKIGSIIFSNPKFRELLEAIIHYTIIKRIHVQRKLSVKHLKGSVDIYYIRNSWFSMVLKRDVKNILTKLERG